MRPWMTIVALFNRFFYNIQFLCGLKRKIFHFPITFPCRLNICFFVGFFLFVLIVGRKAGPKISSVNFSCLIPWPKISWLKISWLKIGANRRFTLAKSNLKKCFYQIFLRFFDSKFLSVHFFFYLQNFAKKCCFSTAEPRIISDQNLRKQFHQKYQVLC